MLCDDLPMFLWENQGKRVYCITVVIYYLSSEYGYHFYFNSYYINIES